MLTFFAVTLILSSLPLSSPHPAPGFSDWYKTVVTVVTTSFNKVTAFAADVVNDLKTKAADAMNQVKTMVAGVVNSTSSVAGSLANSTAGIKSAIGNTLTAKSSGNQTQSSGGGNKTGPGNSG